MLGQTAWVSPSRSRRALLTALLAVLTLAIFGLDTQIPSETAVPLLYLIVIPLSTGYRDRRHTLALAVVCSILAVAGYFAFPGPPNYFWQALANRLLSLMAIGSCTMLSLQRILAQERFHLIVEAAPNGVIAVNQEGLIVLANEQVEQLFGYGRRELLGEPIEALLPGRLRPSHVGERNRFLREPKSRPMGQGRDLFGRRKDGSEFPIEIGLNPVRTPEGNFVLASVVDITERKGSERVLARHTADLLALNTELRLSNADLDAFAHLASHDLQEPIRTLVSYLALLRDDLGCEIAPQAATDLHFISETARRMQSLVQDLLSFSRAGRQTMKREPVELDRCADEAMQSLGALINESGAEIHRDPLPTVAGDFTLLTQIYQNLLGNALKFTQPGQRAVIHLTAAKAGADYQLGVKDNGIGIDPQYADQIFEPFKRLNARNVYPGSGIGLALCRRAVERHGGRIWVESQPGQGSRFSFLLPGLSEKVRTHAESLQTGGLVSRG